MNTLKLKNVFIEKFEMREAYKALRTNLQFCGDTIKTIVVTSCEKNEGKSSISIELAKSLSEINKKVLLIDADLRKSVFATTYADTRIKSAGLSQFLSGQASLDDVIYSTQFTNLFVIFAGHLLPNPTELLSSEKLKLTLDNAKQHFDYIIIDSPPLGAVIDSAIIASVSDASIIVITENKISYRFAKEIKEQLEKSGCRILGVVLNQNDKKFSKKYYGKYYRHYGKYGYGKYGYGKYGNSSYENTELSSTAAQYADKH